MVGRKVLKYELLEEVGHGGMATVYRGFDTALRREVAIKILHRHLHGDPESRERFAREARAVARLRHANIVEIYDYAGGDAEELFIVSEFVQGTTLKRFHEQHRPIPPEVGALLGVQIANALSHAHAHGVVHRDIKPENILLGQGGAVKLTDFGIAQVADTTTMTVTGQILGSPAHMAPEQIETGKRVDHRADLFSFGTLLYLLVVGRLPFEGKNPHEVIRKIADGDYVDPVQACPAMGERLGGIIRRCLRLDPAERPATVDALRGDLVAFLAELELLDIDVELRAYLADPEGYAARHRPRMIDALTRRGDEMLARGERMRALDFWNRVLALDEANAPVIERLRRMTRRRAWGRVTLAAVAAAAAVAIGVAGTRAVRARADRRAAAEARARAAARTTFGFDRMLPIAGNVLPSTGISPAPSPVPSSPSPAAGDRLRGTQGTAAVRREETALPAPPGDATPRVVVFVPNPQGVEIFVDGRSVGPYGPSTARMPIAPGLHRFRFVGRDGCCFNEEIEMRVPPGPGETRVVGSLRWRPARLLVRTNAPASVDVAGIASGRAHALLDVPIARGPSQTFSVLVRPDRGIPSEHSVALRAGQLVTLVVQFPPPGAP